MDNKYIKIDLHIHTPSSSCYDGNGKGNDIYNKIIETAHENGLRIIAITDHNTVEGYEHIVQMREQIKTDYQVLMRYNKIDESDSDNPLNYLKKKNKAFNELLILPGVELTVNPGVHIIVIASPDNLDILKQIIAEIGYTDSNRGKDSGLGINTDVHTLLNNPLLENCIVMAPHIDSDKGIYNELKGDYRASIFKNTKLMCVTCNNPNQKKKIHELLTNEPLYKRETPIAFLDASDSHCINDIGNKYSLIKKSTFDYNGVYQAILEPEKNIKPPEILTEIEEIIESGVYTVFERYSEDTIKEISKHMCAQLNVYGKSTIVLGISEKPQLTCHGVSIIDEDLPSFIRKIDISLSSAAKSLSIMYRTEMLGNGYNVIILRARALSPYLWYLSNNEETYYCENKKIKKASILDIEQIAIQKVIDSMKPLEENNNRLIDKTVNVLDTIRNPVSQYEIMVKISRNASNIKHIVKVEHMKEKPLDKPLEANLKGGFILGKPYGDVYYLEDGLLPLTPHYDDTYLRCSCPCVTSLDISPDSDSKKYNGPKMLVAKQGSVLIAEGQSWSIEHTISDILLLNLNKKTENQYSIYGLLGWFKSSIFIWYIRAKYNSTSFYPPHIYRNTIVPNLAELTLGGVVEEKVKNIIFLEKEFLHNAEMTINDCKSSKNHVNCPWINSAQEADVHPCEDIDNCTLDDITDQHNNAVREIAQDIDQIFFTALEINDDEIKVISDNITSYGIYNFVKNHNVMS